MTLLLIDVPNLAARNFYGRPAMISEQGRREVIDGVIMDLERIKERFATHDAVLCFDKGRPKRCELLPGYKAGRDAVRSLFVNSGKDYKFLREQLHLLRDEILPELGYKNVLHANGYEADDVIASIARLYEEEMIIVSGDKDFYQLLRQNEVCVYDQKKKKIYREKDFIADWNFPPWKWAILKAITGCNSDDVPGISGVGEKYASYYIRNELTRQSRAYKAIKENWDRVVKRNLELVSLPYAGTPEFDLIPQKRIRPAKIIGVYEDLGIPVPRKYHVEV